MKKKILLKNKKMISIQFYKKEKNTTKKLEN